ncbi:MAG: hypothetical protein WAW88_18065 [Nocardioides sp.]
MAFKQYTGCSTPSTWLSGAAYVAIATAGLAAVLALAGFASGPCGLILLEVFAAASGAAFCDWWLNMRLVCLGGDESVVGMVVSVEPPSEKDWPGSVDSDFSMNLLVYPTMPGVTQADLETSSPYGRLAARTPDLKSHISFFTGESATDAHGTTSAVLHAEFEGAGIVALRTALLVAYGIAAAAYAVCFIPVVGWIAALILALLALLAAFLGTLLGDDGSPGDVTGSPTEFHQPDPATGLGADLLYVAGRWVFDSLHTGWNEIHPIKVCTKVGSWDGAWPGDIEQIKEKLDDGFATAGSDEVHDAQGRPENKWEIHPAVDGCVPRTRPPDIG